MFEPKQKSKKDSRMKTSILAYTVEAFCVSNKEHIWQRMCATYICGGYETKPTALCFLSHLPTPKEIIAISLQIIKTYAVHPFCDNNQPDFLSFASHCH